MTSLFAFLPNLGATELMVVGFVALLIFGNRLPSIMRSLGQGVTEFKKGLAEESQPQNQEQPPSH